MNKKRVLSLVIVLIAVLAIGGFGAFKYDSEKKFSFHEKNSYAMGTIVSQKVYGDFAAKYIEKGTELVNATENIISKNISASAVAVLNKKGSVTSKDTADILRECVRLTDLSGGAFDVTVGKVVSLWNFDGDNRKLPDRKELSTVLACVGAKKLELNGNTVKLQKGAEVDLGAVGKGIACDNLIALYKATADVKGAVVSVGGSVGCFGKYNKAGDKWRIAIRHPRDDSQFLGVLKLDEGFVSTSGDYEKYFETDGKRYHHILDARTGYPASSGLISVTVVCKSGFLSDALSTACFILGEEKGKALAESYNASAIFVDDEMNITTVGELDFEGQ